MNAKVEYEKEFSCDKADEILAVTDKCNLLQSKIISIFQEFHPKTWLSRGTTSKESIAKWNYREIVDFTEDWMR